MFCSKCGKENQVGSKFCVRCGQQLIEESSNQVNNENNQASVVREPVNNINTNNSNKKNNKSNNKIIILVVVILVIGTVVILGGKFVIEQIKLNIVDEQLQEEAKNINDILNDDFNSSDSEESTKKTYNVGEKINLVDGSSWYVMFQNGDNLTLLSTENYGDETYFSTSISTNYYEASIVKEKIDNEFLPALKTSLLNNGGDVTNLSARIISLDEVRRIIGVDLSIEPDDIEISSDYSWLYETGNYWTSSHAEDDTYESVYIVESWGVFGYINEDIAGLGLTSGNKFYIRPVVETTMNNVK